MEDYIHLDTLDIAQNLIHQPRPGILVDHLLFLQLFQFPRQCSGDREL